MPLLTYLSSDLELNLFRDVNNKQLAEVMEKCSLSFRDINQTLWELKNADDKNEGEGYARKLSTLLDERGNFSHFDEKTWILLHLICADLSEDEVRVVTSKISCWVVIAATPEQQENPLASQAIQALLFLMSQPGFELTTKISAAILASEDYWAYFALLSHSSFLIDANSGYRANIYNALKNAILRPYIGEYEKINQESFLWVFMKSTAINAASKKNLLNNLAILNFNEAEISQWPVEVLATLVTLSNNISDCSNLKFRAVLFRSYILQVPIQLSSDQTVQLNGKSQKKNWSVEEAKNAQLTMLQGEYFVIIDKFLGVIAAPGLFDAIQNKLELWVKLNTILMLEIVNAGESQFNVANRFFGSVFQILWGAMYKTPRSILDESLLCLMDLEVFKQYFSFPLSQKTLGRVATNFLAMLQAKDEFFVGNFFGLNYYDNNKINWTIFPGNYFSAFVQAIIQYGNEADNHSQLLSSEVKPIKILSYIFDARRTVADLHKMKISKSTNEAVFIRALTEYFAPALIMAMENQDEDEKEISYKRIRRTADLVKLLSSEKQEELYKDDRYILFRAINRSMKYAHQLDKNERRGFGRDAKKEAKMAVLNWIIFNFEEIKKHEFSSSPIMKFLYNQYGPERVRTNDMMRVAAWTRNVILNNRPIAQGAMHGFGFFGTVERGQKGSKMAETLALFSDEQLLITLFEGTGITLLEIWNAAHPGNKCSNEKERLAKRNSMLQEIVQRDIRDEEDASITSYTDSVDDVCGNQIVVSPDSDRIVDDAGWNTMADSPESSSRLSWFSTFSYVFSGTRKSGALLDPRFNG